MKNPITSLTPFSDLSGDATEILTVSELAEYLGVGKNRIYELLNNGTIKGFRIGSTWRISKIAVDTYIRKSSNL